MAPELMRFATQRIEGEWDSGLLFPLTREIVAAAQRYAWERWSWAFFLTCIFRTSAEDSALEGSGVHVAWRAVDVRTRNADPDAVADVTAFVNRAFTYDPVRPRLAVAYAKPHGSGPHLHIQAHMRTIPETLAMATVAA
jgi:hypothetical protein